MKALLSLAFLILFFYFLSLKAVFASDVLINEFLPNPISGDSEWVELYNTVNSTVDLSDYFFDDDSSFDSDSGSSSKIALSGLLPPSKTCYLDLSSFLNNNGDTPTLFKSGISSDSYTYSSSSAGLSYSRVPDGGSWLGLQQPTKSQARCSDLAPTPTSTIVPTSSPTNSPTPTVSPKPISTLTPTPTKKQITPTPTEFLIKSSTNSSVLGINTENISTTPAVQTEAISKSENILPKIFIILGLVFIALCIGIISFPYIKNLKKGKIENE